MRYFGVFLRSVASHAGGAVVHHGFAILAFILLVLALWWFRMALRRARGIQ